VKDRSASAAR
jgi:hypothetical protein